MPRSLSKSQIDKLGKRLASAPVPASDDLASLEHLRGGDYAKAADAVFGVIRSLGVLPGDELTTRLKTNATVLDKLRRGTRLSSMQDLAGVRVTRRMSLAQQDEFALSVRRRFAGSPGEPLAEITDRRATPKHGYRAVHVVVTVDGCPVEVQVRTVLQHLWALAYERLADLPEFGRGIRYGGVPVQARTAQGQSTAQILSSMMLCSTQIAKFEELGGEGHFEPVIRGYLAQLLEMSGDIP